MQKSNFPTRNPNSHKGECGKVLIVAGSHKYHGAPIFNMLAAEMSGADLITLYLPHAHVEVAKNNSLNCFIKNFVKGNLGLKDIGLILEDAKKCDVLLIGSGIGGDNDSKKAIEMILRDITIPVVLDADALFPEILNIKRKSEWLITPHKGEFLRLFGIDASEESVYEMAKKHSLNILLKSPVDIISNGSEKHLNKTGCNQMRVGGTGDALAGICASFIAQRVRVYEAAKAAAYSFGIAGEMLAQKRNFFTTKTLIRHFSKKL